MPVYLAKNKLNFTFRKRHTYGSAYTKYASRKQAKNFERRDVFENGTIRPVLSDTLGTLASVHLIEGVR